MHREATGSAPGQQNVADCLLLTAASRRTCPSICHLQETITVIPVFASAVELSHRSRGFPPPSLFLSDRGRFCLGFSLGLAALRSIKFRGKATPKMRSCVEG